MPGKPTGDVTAGQLAGVTAGQLAGVHEAAARFFRERMAGSWVPGYLAARGFDAATQRRWQAGYAPAEWDALARHLRGLGYPGTVVEAAGLAHRSGRGTLIDTFRDRATLPIHRGDGVIAAFIGRAPEHAGPGVPKYLNSPRTALYRKRATLFGLWAAREQLAAGATPVLVEGPLDAIAVTSAAPGRYAGFATCGSALSTEQAAALGQCCDLRAAGVLVAFDPDRAGRGATLGAYRLLAGRAGGLRAAMLPPGRDPAQILRERGPRALAAALAAGTVPLADLVVDAQIESWRRWLRYPEGQFHALRAIAPQVAAMPAGDVARQVARLAAWLGLDHATVTEAVTDALRDGNDGASRAAARNATSYE